MTTSRIGLMGGTGLGQALLAEVDGKPHDVETPFGKPSAPIVCGTWQGMDIAFLPRHGADHTFAPSVVPYRANIYALKSLGVTHILASGAVGSLREEFRPRDLVIPDQVIDKTTRRKNTFFDQPGIAAHIEFASPFCQTLRSILLKAGESLDLTLHDGATYVCMEGPAFSTIAESRMHRSWGGDLIGMTCLPEAKLAREAEICYALIALPTDYDCWRTRDDSRDGDTLLREITGNLKHAVANSIELIKAALNAMAESALTDCACRRALDMAVWTQRDKIDPSSIRKSGVILKRFLDS